MLKKIDKFSKRHSQSRIPHFGSLKANQLIHVAGFSAFAALGVAFLRYSKEPLLGEAVGLVSLIALCALVITGWACMSNHNIL